MSNAQDKVAVLCFIRSPILWGVAEKRWLQDGRAPRPSLNTRTNLMRLLCAAEFALKEEADLWIVEGWQIHKLKRQNGSEVLLRGSAMGAILVRSLVQEGLLSQVPRLRLKPRSRCTVQEVDAFMKEASHPKHVFAVAGPSCPSVLRVRRVFRLQHGLQIQALSIGDAGGVEELLATAYQKSFMERCKPSFGEVFSNLVSETVNWGLHGVSEMLKPLLGYALEVRLAERLRGGKKKPPTV